MITIFTGYIFYLVLLTGFGTAALLLLSRVTGKRFRYSREMFFTVLWSGMIVAFPVIELISIFAPLNSAVALCLFALSCALLLCARKSDLSPAMLWRLIQSERLKATGFLILGLSLALLSTRQSHRPDLFFYYLDVIDFAGRYPAIPGLVNLNPSLAYNNTLHLFTAILDSGPWDLRSVYVPLGVIYWAGIGHFLSSAYRVFKNEITMEGLFSFFMLPFLAYTVVTGTVSSAGTNELTWLLTALVVKYLLAMGGEKEKVFPGLSGTLSRESLHPFLPAFFIALTAFINKLSAFPVFAAIMVASLLFCRGLCREKRGRNIIFASIAFSAIVLAIHVGRNAILSGWVWFPSPAGNFGFDWSFPADSMLKGIQAKQAEARMMGRWWAWDPSASFLVWLCPLLKAMLREKGFLLLLCSVPVFFLSLMLRCFMRSEIFSFPWWIAVLVCAGGVVFVGSQNPYIDYAYGYIWCFAALSLAGLFSLFDEAKFFRPMAVAVLVLITAWYYSYSLPWHVKDFISRVNCQVLLTVPPHATGTSSIDFSKGRWRIGDLPILYTFPVPQKGNPWYPRENTFLEMREPGDLSRGFRLSFEDGR